MSAPRRHASAFFSWCLVASVAACSNGTGGGAGGEGGSSVGAGGNLATGGGSGTGGVGNAPGGGNGGSAPGTGGAVGGNGGTLAVVDAGTDASSSAGGKTGQAGGGGNTGGGAATGGASGGASAGHGGGAGSGGTGIGTGGTGTGGSGIGGTGTGTGGGGTGGSAPFTCNLMVGPSPMYQFFNGGFLTYPGIDANRWELIWVAGHYTNAWAVPGDAAWNTPVSHACAQGSATPDRVAFMATQWKETTAAEWETDFVGIIKNILAKWPMVKRIELLPSTSTPGDVPCPGTGPEKSETMIPAYGYQAIDAMPAMYPGLVYSTPHFEVPQCSDFIYDGGGPQYAPNAQATTGPAVMDVAGVFGAYYAAHP